MVWTAILNACTSVSSLFRYLCRSCLSLLGVTYIVFLSRLVLTSM